MMIETFQGEELLGRSVFSKAAKGVIKYHPAAMAFRAARSGIKSRGKNISLFGENFFKRAGKAAIKYHPATMTFKAARSGIRSRGRHISLFGEPTWNDILLGAAKKKRFLPGVMKVAKKIGKTTAPITSAVAKAFLPASVVDLAAKFDPTRKRVTPKTIQAALEQSAKDTTAMQAIVPGTETKTALMKTLTDPRVLGIAAGGIVLITLMSRRGK